MADEGRTDVEDLVPGTPTHCCPKRSFQSEGTGVLLRASDIGPVQN